MTDRQKNLERPRRLKTVFEPNYGITCSRDSLSRAPVHACACSMACFPMAVSTVALSPLRIQVKVEAVRMRNIAGGATQRRGFVSMQITKFSDRRSVLAREILEENFFFLMLTKI